MNFHSHVLELSFSFTIKVIKIQAIGIIWSIVKISYSKTKCSTTIRYFILDFLTINYVVWQSILRNPTPLLAASFLSWNMWYPIIETPRTTMHRRASVCWGQLCTLNNRIPCILNSRISMLNDRRIYVVKLTTTISKLGVFLNWECRLQRHRMESLYKCLGISRKRNNIHDQGMGRSALCERR